MIYHTPYINFQMVINPHPEPHFTYLKGELDYREAVADYSLLWCHMDPCKQKKDRERKTER